MAPYQQQIDTLRLKLKRLIKENSALKDEVRKLKRLLEEPRKDD